MMDIEEAYQAFTDIIIFVFPSIKSQEICTLLHYMDLYRVTYA
jgi:hypothetical protein